MQLAFALLFFLINRDYTLISLALRIVSHPIMALRIVSHQAPDLTYRVPPGREGAKQEIVNVEDAILTSDNIESVV